MGTAYDSTKSGIRDLVFQLISPTGVTVNGKVSYLNVPAPKPGDYNNDGTVDAADYVVYRNHKGETFTLTNVNPAAATPGVVDLEDYTFWKAQYTATHGAGSGSAVPEPTSLLAAILCGLCLVGGVRRKR